ncbi:MAG: hypothetical protein ACJ8HJ_00600 [Massilia sp.]
MSAITTAPNALYTCEQLMRGYLPDEPASIAATFTFEQYLAFEPYTLPGRLDETGLAAIGSHDAAINALLLDYLYGDGAPQKIVGVMGGHSVPRSGIAYRDIADLARFLTNEGYLIVTGGGPGLMEAAHVGAYFSGLSPLAWEGLLARLATINPGSAADVIPYVELLPAGSGERLSPRDQEGLHAWYRYAAELRAELDSSPGTSLAISTWQYGREPVMPFATAYACYFQNSIRESQLVRESRAGMIYGKGGGGTLREIWQDVEENYYADSRSKLTPMIFFDRAGAWGDLQSNGTKPLDIYGTVLRVMNTAHAIHHFSWEDKIVATTNHQKILQLLDGHVSMAQRKMSNLVSAIRAEE